MLRLLWRISIQPWVSGGICLEVEDIEGMLAILKEKGARLINETPIELPGRKMAFIHPKTANGVLVELYELI